MSTPSNSSSYTLLLASLKSCLNYDLLELSREWKGGDQYVHIKYQIIAFTLTSMTRF